MPSSHICVPLNCMENKVSVYMKASGQVCKVGLHASMLMRRQAHVCLHTQVQCMQGGVNGCPHGPSNSTEMAALDSPAEMLPVLCRVCGPERLACRSSGRRA